MRAKSKLLALGLAVTAVAVAVWIWLPPAPVAEQAAAALETGAGELDGLTFASEIGPVGAPADVKDTLAFADGLFVSRECERLCNYPASAYFVREADGATEFVSETRCPHKDATIVWRGRVADGEIDGVATWTVRRWYWTIEKDLAFSGHLIDPDSPVASAD